MKKDKQKKQTKKTKKKTLCGAFSKTFDGADCDFLFINTGFGVIDLTDQTRLKRSA